MCVCVCVCVSMRVGLMHSCQLPKRSQHFLNLHRKTN